MKETLSVRYARFPQMRVKLNITPMGTIARLKTASVSAFPPITCLIFLSRSSHMYVRVVIGTLWRESRVLVKRAMYWVMIVPKTWCHVVKKSAAVANC